MSRNRLRPSLRVESVEARDVPSGFGAAFGGIVWDPSGGVFDPGPAYTAASIAFDAGTVNVVGTEGADLIRIDTEQPVVAQALFFNPGDVTFWNQIRVTVSDPAGNVRLDALGQPLRRYFSPSQVYAVNVDALGGDDRVVNTTARTMGAGGGFGNDTLQGGTGSDFLNGDAGNDSLLGGAGNDALNGGTDQDVLVGEAGNDLVDGAAGNDRVDGGTGNDTGLGGTGKDTVSGGFGDDDLLGGDGFSGVDDADVLGGGAGNDRLRGEAGPDILFGGDGNDSCYGGAGNDVVFGEWGNDGLFGGSGKDTLIGGTGIDRFLRWTRSGSSTTVQDRAAAESLTTFKGTTSQQVDAEDGPDLRYAPGEWTEAEIEAVDAGLAWLHSEVGNTRMLKTKGGTNLTFVRWGNYIPYDTTDGNNDAAETEANQSGAGITGSTNGSGTIVVRQIDPTDVHETNRLVIHEIAHNWDNENPKWTEWMGLSGWVKATTAGMGQTLSQDGQWVYDSAAAFARSYGTTNPREDFATSLEALYQLKTGTLPASALPGLIPKLNFLGLFISSLA